MGQWGVKSDEGDDVADALDDAFGRVHGPLYEELMDDRNPLTYEQVHQRLASPATLAAAIEALHEAFGDAGETWEADQKLAFAGVVVHHAELGVPIPDDVRRRAIGWLESEEIDWEEETLRRLRRQKEIDLLTRADRGGRHGQ